jgi:4-amino-4-deoxy-L-arabinose transferase-like glycosyltransferase/sugar lactone lactonase YvrE
MKQHRWHMTGLTLVGRAPALVLMLAVGLALATQLVVVPQGVPLAAIALFLAAGLLAMTAMRARPLAPCEPVPVAVEAIGLMLVLGAALFFRFYQLDSAPEGVWYDEAQQGNVALRMLSDPTFRPVYLGRYDVHLPALHIYWQAIAIALLGPTIVALRLVTTLVGLVSVVGTYALARQLFGVPVALAAGLLVAVERWHVNFSRTAMNGILAPTVALGVFYFALRGLQTGSRLDMALAGVCLGLGIYSYTPFNMVPLILGCTVLALFLRANSPRSLLAARWRGLVLMLAVAVVVMVPMLRYIAEDREGYTERMRVASVFREGKSTDQAVADLVENVRRHLLMLHYRGDPNGRHNLPGEPMVDPITGALLVLGLAYSLRHVRRPEHALLVSWLILGVVPGVLSLEFEAPQGLRSILLTPVVALLPALVIGWLLGRAWEARRRLGGSAVALPAAALIGLAGWANFDTFFNRQLTDFAAWASFSTGETLAARAINALPPDTRVYISEAFAGRPTIRFLVDRRRKLETFDPMQHLPLRTAQPTVLFLSPEIDRRTDLVRALYPAATITEHTGPRGGPSVLTKIAVDPEQIRALQGVQAAFYPGLDADERGQPAATRKMATPALTGEGEPPLPLPFTGVWRSTLVAPAYGAYRFRLEGPASSVLTIDETEVTRGGQDGAELVLAQGNHSLRLRAAFATLEPLRLLWQPPGLRTWQPVAAEALYVEPVRSNGLLGSYYPNKNWAGPPAFTRIDPALSFRFHNLPLPRPWSVEWTGRIHVPVAGIYRFATQSIDQSWLYIDDQLIVDNSRGHDQLVEGSITLTPGFHTIRVRFNDQTNFTHIEVYWQPPGGGRQLIPSERLFPVQPSDPRALPPLAGAAGPSGAPAPAPAANRGAATVIRPTVATLVTPDRLGPGQPPEPRGVAVDGAGNVYVVDTANKRVSKLDASGQLLFTAGPGEGEAAFVEPVAAAVAPDGQVVVLDSKTGWLHRFDAAGQPAGRAGGPAARFFQPRGFDIDGAGAVYLADTGNGRVVRLNADGSVEGQFGQKGQAAGQIQEPTDVAVDRQGTVFIADSANRKAVVFAADGTLRAEWAIPDSTSVIGPHLAPDGNGGVYVTDPDGGMIRHYGASGELLAEIGPLEADGVPARRPLAIKLAAPNVLIVSDVESRRVLRVTLP